MRNCEKQFSQVVDMKTLVSDIKILCTVDQDVFHHQILLTQHTQMVGPPQPVSTCVLYKCDLIVVCRELAVLCDDLYLTVIHILMWAAPNEVYYDFFWGGGYRKCCHIAMYWELTMLCHFKIIAD